MIDFPKLHLLFFFLFANSAAPLPALLPKTTKSDKELPPGNDTEWLTTEEFFNAIEQELIKLLGEILISSLKKLLL